MQNNAQGKDQVTNDVVLFVLNNEETQDATSCSEEEEDEIHISIERDIQEFNDTRTMY